MHWLWRTEIPTSIAMWPFRLGTRQWSAAVTRVFQLFSAAVYNHNSICMRGVPGADQLRNWQFFNKVMYRYHMAITVLRRYIDCHDMIRIVNYIDRHKYINMQYYSSRVHSLWTLLGCPCHTATSAVEESTVVHQPSILKLYSQFQSVSLSARHTIIFLISILWEFIGKRLRVPTYHRSHLSYLNMVAWTKKMTVYLW